jgi:phospholipid-binding lipoprotein MlaA
VSYLNVIANNLLQAKFTGAAVGTGRFLVNSTVGIGGLFDPATSMGLPVSDEDLGQTFGKWGMGEGRYVVLPLTGPNSVRDLPNVASAAALNPLVYLTAAVTVPLGVLQTINMRANLLEETNIRDQAALDPYTFVREAYRQRREFLIYDGNPPSESIDDYLNSPDEPKAADESSVLKVY